MFSLQVTTTSTQRIFDYQQKSLNLYGTLEPDFIVRLLTLENRQVKRNLVRHDNLATSLLSLPTLRDKKTSLVSQDRKMREGYRALPLCLTGNLSLVLLQSE